MRKAGSAARSAYARCKRAARYAGAWCEGVGEARDSSDIAGAIERTEIHVGWGNVWYGGSVVVCVLSNNAVICGAGGENGYPVSIR